MSWRNFLYILLVIVIAGGSALAGALAGGAVVYRTLQGQPANLPAPLQEVVPSDRADLGQTLTLNSTDIETAIIRAVEEVGPGDRIALEIVRGQETLPVQVVPGEAKLN